MFDSSSAHLLVLSSCALMLSACGKERDQGAAVREAESRPAAARAAAPKKKLPNVILISVDMLRPDHLSSYGYARKTSPEIDRLAQEGVLFENQISSSCWTLPAHAAMFTSLPDSLHNCTDTDQALAPEATTLAERFQAAGYQTAGFFAGPYLHPAFGLDQGFQHYENCTSYREKLDDQPSESWAMSPGVMHDSHRDITNPTVIAAVDKWLAARKEGPFFLFIHLWDPHFDFIPPPPYDKVFDPDYKGTITGENFFFDERINPNMDPRDLEHLIALYDGEIAWTDMHIGKIRASLERAGLLDQTVLAVTSDHGTEFFEHGAKGHRQALFDESIKVPLVVRYPSRLKGGARVSEQTRGIDLGPTLCDLAGLPVPKDVMGESLMRIVNDPRAPHDTRAVSELFSVGQNLRTVRTREWKWLDDIGGGGYAYFDLKNDPGEKTTLSDRESELGQNAEAGYLGAFETMKAFAAKHPMASDSSEIPEEVKKQLRDLGY